MRRSHIDKSLAFLIAPFVGVAIVAVISAVLIVLWLAIPFVDLPEVP